MITSDDFNQNFEFMFQFYRYLINVTGVHIHVNMAIIEWFTSHNITVVLSDMWAFFVPQSHESLFFVLESLTMLFKRRLFT